MTWKQHAPQASPEPASPAQRAVVPVFTAQLHATEFEPL
jgi:hypothetical protein